MAYFLKTSKLPKDLYYQIYFSYRDPDSGKPRNKSYRALGYLCDLKAQGIDDPAAYFKPEIDELNEKFRIKREKEKVRQITHTSPLKRIGYFPAHAVYRKLDVKEDIDRLSFDRDIQFSLSDTLEALAMARLIDPCSKLRTVDEVFPSMWDAPDCSYDQILSCLDILGNDYEKVVEILAHHVDDTYIIDTSKTYFDCTNFYFEIDKEDEWRRKGPSKERRTDPILGMDLLLDSQCIPIGMRLYPGNQSEKPVFRKMLKQMKDQHCIKGRTIRVADKGLNCAQNIKHALSHGDGYIFSKSIKMLSNVEKAWALKDDDVIDVKDSNGNLRYCIKSCVDTFKYHYKDESGREHHFAAEEKRVTTYNPTLARKQKIEINKMADKARACRLCEAKKIEYGDSAKYAKFRFCEEDGTISDRKAVVEIDEEKIQRDLDCAGYNMIVTSEKKMNEMDIYSTYHELCRIEESFRTLKSQLDARSVYLQTINRIKGHFLVCYLSILLERLAQFKILKNEFGSEEVYKFMRGFKIVPGNGKTWINVTARNSIIEYITDAYNLPLTNYYLKESQIKKILERSM